MSTSVTNKVLEVYGCNTTDRYDFFADEDFSISQHVLSKDKFIGSFHTHSYYELEIILYGDAYEVINGNKYKTKQGDFFFLSSTELHRVEIIDNDLVLLCIKIKHEIFTPKIQKILKSLGFPMIGNMSEEEYIFVGECIEKIEKMKGFIEDYDLLREIVIKMLEALVIYIICRNNNKDYSKWIDDKNDQMINAITYVRENYNEDISMKSVARKIGYSYNYFGNRFKEITGQTFINYLNDIRLGYAYNKLILSEDSVESICKSVGFENMSYFYRKFKEKYKCTPRELRISMRDFV